MTDEDDLDQEEEEAPALSPKELAKLQKELKRAQEEAKKLRLDARKAKIEKDFGADVVELIPDELPAEKWEEFAGKLKDKLVPKAEQDQAPSEEPPAPPQGDAPAGLAAVAAPSPASAQAPAEMKTAEEIRLIGLQDPNEALRLIREGRMADVGPNTYTSRTDPNSDH